MKTPIAALILLAMLPCHRAGASDGGSRYAAAVKITRSDDGKPDRLVLEIADHGAAASGVTARLEVDDRYLEAIADEQGRVTIPFDQVIGKVMKVLGSVIVPVELRVRERGVPVRRESFDSFPITGDLVRSLYELTPVFAEHVKRTREETAAKRVAAEAEQATKKAAVDFETSKGALPRSAGVVANEADAKYVADVVMPKIGPVIDARNEISVCIEEYRKNDCMAPISHLDRALRSLSPVVEARSWPASLKPGADALVGAVNDTVEATNALKGLILLHRGDSPKVQLAIRDGIRERWVQSRERLATAIRLLSPVEPTRTAPSSGK